MKFRKMFALEAMKSRTVPKTGSLKPNKDSVSDHITTLRGWYKGPGSLLTDRELDHKRDERIKNRKFAKMMGRLSQRQRDPDCLF